MVGLTILAVVAVYIAIVWWLVRFVLKKNWARAVVILAAIAIPFWDIPIGYVHFQTACSSEGGLRVHEDIGPQRSVYFQSSPPYSANELLARGFKVVEIRRQDGKGIARHQLGDGGTLVTKDIAKAESPIRVEANLDQRLRWNIWRDDEFVYRATDARELARYSMFRWRGGWLQNSFAPILGTGLHCHANPKHPLIAWLAR